MSRDSEGDRAERVVDEGRPGALDSGARRGAAAGRLQFSEGNDPANTVKDPSEDPIARELTETYAARHAASNHETTADKASRRGRIPDATEARLPTTWPLARGCSCARLRAGRGRAVQIPAERT